MRWQGIFPALTTKFGDDLTLDLPAFERHAAWQVESGVDGLVVAGSLGEGSTLSADERLELARAARDAAGGRVPVVMTVAESATERATGLARRAEAAGVDGLMVLPPLLYHASPEETVAWFRAVADASGLPVMVYNNPVSYKVDVTPEMLGDLASHPRVAAVKESSDDVRRITRVRNALGDRLAIFTGVDNLALESLAVGADGWVAGLVDAFPAETVALWRLWREGRHDEALAIYRWFTPLLELDVSPRLVQHIKLAEALVGVGDERVRPPRLPLDGPERERVRAVVEQALARRPALPDVAPAARAVRAA